MSTNQMLDLVRKGMAYTGTLSPFEAAREAGYTYGTLEFKLYSQGVAVR